MSASGPNSKGRFLNRTSTLGLYLLLLCCLHDTCAAASLTGLLDQSFAFPQFDSNVITSSFLLEEQSALLQKDGRIIIHGSFEQIGGVSRKGLARLNVDGSLDTSFNAGSVPTYQIFAMALQPDGKVVLGGSFATFNGEPAVRLVRLNPDGSRDASLNVGSGPTFRSIGDYAPVFALSLQPDGRIIIGGDFGFVNGIAANGVARLMTNGEPDRSFDTSKVSLRWVRTCAVQADGRILVEMLMVCGGLIPMVRTMPISRPPICKAVMSTASWFCPTVKFSLQVPSLFKEFFGVPS